MKQNLNTQSDIMPEPSGTLPIDAAQVESYLQQHPDFFTQHLQLLEQLTIPHPSGNAVSLISKQLELFRNRHQDLEKKLNELLIIAQENDTLFNRMHELTLALLESDTLEHAIANLHKVLTDCFLSDFVSLKIFQEYADFPINHIFVTANKEHLALFSKELGKNLPRCGMASTDQLEFLFAESATEVKSCAMIPLTCDNQQGLLAIGSHDPERFQNNMGNLFLVQMSEIISCRFNSLLTELDHGATT